jgi:predicted ATPase
MAITKVKVSNFKSFDELAVELRPLNIVVGGNASGKSNFLEIFRFLRDLGAYGLENAISLQGGMEYLTNLRIGAARPLILEWTYDDEEYFSGDNLPDDARDLAHVGSATYRLVLGFASAAPGFQILEESLTPSSAAGSEEIPRPGIATADGPPPPGRDRLHRFPSLPFELAIFDFEPKLARRTIPVSGKADLEPDGSNLAIVLRKVLRAPGKRETFVRLLKDLLPFVDDLKVDRFADESLRIALKERFAPGSYLPASLLSEGTIHLAAIVLALYFERAAVTLFEEPESHLHPHLISRLVGLFRDAARQKQILVTTHSPELVKHADLSDLLLVHRDERGFSRLSRPAESAELQVFLAHDLGVDELYVQDLLHTAHGV